MVDAYLCPKIHEKSNYITSYSTLSIQFCECTLVNCLDTFLPYGRAECQVIKMDFRSVEVLLITRLPDFPTSEVARVVTGIVMIYFGVALKKKMKVRPHV